MAFTQSHLHDEVFKFLVSSPTPQEIIDFRPSKALQERVSHLLDANRNHNLTDIERMELDELEQINHFVSMLKIYARKKLAEIN